jgi:predicted RNA binding protein YcfA (HicA-like mRNA interferase family)
MKRNAFIKILNERGVFFTHQGKRHEIFVHQKTGKKIPIPRHQEIKDSTVRAILKEIPED